MATDSTIDLGPPSAGVTDMGRFSVASEPIPDSGSLPSFVQYAKPDDDVEATIGRLWLFLGAGVLGGTIMALLAGLAVADRAMRPIAALTSLARDIATTRDPSRRMPIPVADDEIGELAETMDGMLESLDEARAERERAFERQREFVADASHELRTPLTSVQANLELLQASLDGGDPEDRHAVDSALGSSRRMSRLVSDLLLLARADAGRRSARTEVDLSEVARAVVAELEPLSEGRTVHTSLDRELVVDGNRDELHRLVLNLRRERAPPHPRGLQHPRQRSPRWGVRRARGRRRRPGDPPGDRASRSSTASCGATARPTRPPAAAAGWAWRSFAPSPTLTAARSRLTRPPTAGPASPCGFL